MPNIGKTTQNHMTSGTGQESDKPQASKPATQEGMSHNDRLMADIASTRDPQQRAPKLLELAQQLGSLSSEKSATTKTMEGLHRAGAFIGRATMHRTLPVQFDLHLKQSRSGVVNLEVRTTKSVPSGTLLPTQRDLASRYATPQKKQFDFLMSSLERADRHESSKKLRFMSLTYKFDVKVKTTTAGKAEIDRRVAYGPVWGEMFKHAPALKQERQDKLLNGFKQCFADLPDQASKTSVVRASGDSFKNMAAALADFGDSAHSDKLSDCQKTAFELLNTLRDDMSPEQRTGVLDALEKVAPRFGAINPIPLALETEIMALRRHFG